MQNQPLSPAVEARFRAIVQEYGLIAKWNQLRSEARRCFSIRALKGKPGLGCSRAGGSPDLPLSFDWPRINGEPLTFVAQLNLSELPASIDPLPRSGIVYFFSGQAEAGGGDNKVLYVANADQPLKRRDPPKLELSQNGMPLEREMSFMTWPPHQKRFKHEIIHFKGVGLTYEETACLPPFDPLHNTLDDDEGDAMLEIHDELHLSNSRILGYPYSSIDDLAEDLSRPPDDWEFLFQIDSFQPCADMCWWDNGKLAYFLPRGNLKQCEFGESLACVVGSG